MLCYSSDMGWNPVDELQRRYDPFGLTGRALRGVQHDLNRQHAPAPVLGSEPRETASQYLGGVAKSFDPRHPMGLVNLATVLFPGGRGRGGLTPMQQMYLEQLHTVEGGGSLKAKTMQGQSLNVTRPYRMKETMANTPISKLDVGRSPNLRMLAEHLGHTYGNPLPELLVNTSRTPQQSMSRLGLQTKNAPNGNITNPVDPHSKRLVELIARSAINRRN